MFNKRINRCDCERPPFNYADYKIEILGEDTTYGEVSLNQCLKCGAYWLKYLIEEPHYTNSGRWWRIRISKGELKAITVENAKEYIMSQDTCFVGGSFYKQGIHKQERPIIVK